MTTNSPTNTNQASEEHLDNDKEELKRNIMQVVDGFRFDQEWVSHQADDFPDHKGAGCGCGVCQKMKGINESTADSVLTFVDEYTQSKLKAFAGEVEEAIIDLLDMANINSKIVGNIYENPELLGTKSDIAVDIGFKEATNE